MPRLALAHSVLEVASGLVFALHDGQLRVLAPDLLVDVGGLAHAVQHERPLAEHSLLRLVRVEDDEELPGAARVLRPDVRRHEWPLQETFRRIVVLGAFAQDHRPAKGQNPRSVSIFATSGFIAAVVLFLRQLVHQQFVR